MDDPFDLRVTRSIAIVAAGFSGTMVAVQLARQSKCPGIHVLLFERANHFARGIAYGTDCDKHLLNVPAGGMSALPDQPDHFFNWLLARTPEAKPSSFAPRKLYGEYLDSLLQDAERSGSIKLDRIKDEVVDLDPGSVSKPASLQTQSGKSFEADQIVLALGNPLPQNPLRTDCVSSLPGYCSNPWQKGVLGDLRKSDSLVLIGTGLTAVDLTIQALEQGHSGQITAISRHGLLPLGHRSAVPRPHFRLADGPRTARSVVRAIRKETEVCEAEGGDWRSVVDGLRPIVQDIWRSLPNPERERFLRHAAARWDAHRHRVAPQIEQTLDEALASGGLKLISGRVVTARQSGARIAVEVVRREGNCIESILADRVVNCTGPGRDVRKAPEGLLRTLIERGVGRPGPLALGLDVSDSNRLIDAEGREQKRVLTVGPMLKEKLWETTAVRELRVQAESLARSLVEA